MSRGPGSHQRRILDALEAKGWVWLRDLRYTNASDRTAYWRAARRERHSDLATVLYDGAGKWRSR